MPTVVLMVIVATAAVVIIQVIQIMQVWAVFAHGRGDVCESAPGGTSSDIAKRRLPARCLGAVRTPLLRRFCAARALLALLRRDRPSV